MALIAVDLLLGFVGDVRPELSNVSANEHPVSTKVQAQHTLCCLCCRVVNKPPIRDGSVPPCFESLIVQVHVAKMVQLPRVEMGRRMQLP